MLYCFDPSNPSNVLPLQVYALLICTSLLLAHPDNPHSRVGITSVIAALSVRFMVARLLPETEAEVKFSVTESLVSTLSTASHATTSVPVVSTSRFR